MKKLLWFPLAVAVVASPLAQAQHGGWDGHHGGAPMHFPYSSHYQPHGHFVHDLPLGVACLFLGGLEYAYWEGMYYQRAPNGYVVVPAPVGAVVTTIPDGCQQVVIDGTLYYLINGVTYMKTAYGYQVVPMPSVLVPRVDNTPPPPPQPMVVNVTGSSMPPPLPSPVNVPVPTYGPQPAQAPAAPSATLPPLPPLPPLPAPGAVIANTPAAEPTGMPNDAFMINIPNAKGTYTPVTLRRSGTGFIGPQGEFYPEFPRVEQLKLMYGK